MIDTLVLGARDPEMMAIGRLALTQRLHIIWASKEGQPVTYNQMYQADYPEPAPNQLWVECSPPEGKAGLDFVDHHNPGDPGFEKPPGEFWEASSIGQVWARLCPHQSPPDHLRVLAAMDHCPHAAYSGECKGIDPGSVVAASADEIAATTRSTISDVLRDVYRWIHTFRNAETQRIEGTDFYLHPEPLRSDHLWLIFREAALWHGIGVGARMKIGQEDWVKVAGHTTADFIRAFMAGKVVEGPLERVYGDTHRGYAGAMLVKPLGTGDLLLQIQE